jgi:hypothetical protein
MKPRSICATILLAIATFGLNAAAQVGPPSGIPNITRPGTGSRFHTYETFQIAWDEVPGAHYYLLEADDEPSFSPPHTLTINPMVFGTKFLGGWGNEIPNIYYRVRAVSVDNAVGPPSPTVSVRITNAAPVPPAPVPRAPVGGATVSVPFTFDWSDTANPQIPGYDVDVDDEPNFQGAFGALFIANISRSDYMVAPGELAPGTYFWRVRALHGAVAGPWSAGASFRVAASAPTPPGLGLFWIINEPGSVEGGHATQARVTLNAPAPQGGAVVHIASDMPHAQVPTSVFVPAGATDATVSPISTVPVQGATIGRLRAAYGQGWQQSSLGLFPLLFSLSLSTDTIVGGNSLSGTVTLQRAAPAGGVEVTLVSRNTALVRPPAKVVVPEGATQATFPITTTAVPSQTLVVIDTGTANDGYRAPEAWLTLLPAGSAAPSARLSSVSLQASSILGGESTTGTIR